MLINHDQTHDDDKGSIDHQPSLASPLVSFRTPPLDMDRAYIVAEPSEYQTRQGSHPDRHHWDAHTLTDPRCMQSSSSQQSMDVNEPARKASIFNSFLIMHRLTANRQDFSSAASHADSQRDDSRSALVPGLQKRLRLEQSDLSEYACSSTV